LRQRHLTALRIVVHDVGALRQVVPGCARVVFDTLGVQVEWADNTRCPVSVKHVLGRDARGRSAGKVDDPARLPTLDDSCQRARTVWQQQLVGPNRESERPVGPEVVSARVRLQRIIGVPVGQVRIRSSAATRLSRTQVFAPRVRRLKAGRGWGAS